MRLNREGVIVSGIINKYGNLLLPILNDVYIILWLDLCYVSKVEYLLRVTFIDQIPVNHSLSLLDSVVWDKLP